MLLVCHCNAHVLDSCIFVAIDIHCVLMFTCAMLQYGFTDTTGMCYMGPSFAGDLTGGYMYPLCSNPDSYIFWDPVHPTKHTHALIAAQFISNFPQFNMS